VDRARLVLRRGVDRVEPKVDLAGVHEVVACPGRDVDQSVDGDGDGDGDGAPYPRRRARKDIMGR
jgi:hypothetical protein